MTDQPTPADFEVDDLALPGLTEPTHPAGEVEAAARQTIAALRPQLTGQHGVMCQALITCARQLDRATSSTRSKDYGVAELIGQLRQTYETLVPAGGGDKGDAFDILAQQLGRAAALRDAEEPSTQE